MIVILDASAAANVVLNSKLANTFNTSLKKADWVIAPDLFVSEISNVFWKYHRFEKLSQSECEVFINNGIQLIDDFILATSLYKEAFSFACQTQHTVYDALYLVLTRRQNGTLASADKNLIQTARQHLIKVINI